jgi:hypothetical protein
VAIVAFRSAYLLPSLGQAPMAIGRSGHAGVPDLPRFVQAICHSVLATARGDAMLQSWRSAP